MGISSTKNIRDADKQQAMATSQKPHRKQQERFSLPKDNSEMSWTTGIQLGRDFYRSTFMDF